MKSLPTINIERLVRNLGRGLVLALVLLLAWRIAGWVWYFAAPAPNPSAPDLRSVINVANVARFPWFGVLTPIPVEAPASDIRLIGLFAGGSRPTALLAIGNQNSLAAVLGESFAPGMKLISVAGDHVVVQRNGRNEKIVLAGAGAAVDRTISEKRGK